MPLIPCPRCGCHLVRDTAPSCPHCGTRLGRPAARTAAAVLLGLSLAGCGGDKADADSTDTGTMTMEPEYGVTMTTGDTGQ